MGSNVRVTAPPWVAVHAQVCIVCMPVCVDVHPRVCACALCACVCMPACVGCLGVPHTGSDLRALGGDRADMRNSLAAGDQFPQEPVLELWTPEGLISG